MSLIDQIRMAQRDAGEAAVMADLKRKGLLIEEPKELPEADKLLQQALELFESSDSKLPAIAVKIRTYLENKT